MCCCIHNPSFTPPFVAYTAIIWRFYKDGSKILLSVSESGHNSEKGGNANEHKKLRYKRAVRGKQYGNLRGTDGRPVFRCASAEKSASVQNDYAHNTRTKVKTLSGDSEKRQHNEIMRKKEKTREN